MPVKPSRMRQKATRSSERQVWATTGVECEPSGAIEVPADRLRGGQTPRESSSRKWRSTGGEAKHTGLSEFTVDHHGSVVTSMLEPISSFHVAATVAIFVSGKARQARCSRGYRSEPHHSQGQKAPGPEGLCLKPGPAALPRLPVHHVLYCALRHAGPGSSQQRGPRGLMRQVLVHCCPTDSLSLGDACRNAGGGRVRGWTR